MTTKVQTHPLVSIRADASVQEAARLMADCSMGALGVLDSDKRFSGIVTERDLSWFVAQAKDPCATAVGEIANDFPVVMDGPATDEAILERMRTARIRHLIVREGDDFRIVSIRDYLSLLSPDGDTPVSSRRDDRTCGRVLRRGVLRGCGGNARRSRHLGDAGCRRVGAPGWRHLRARSRACARRSDGAPSGEAAQPRPVHASSH